MHALAALVSVALVFLVSGAWLAAPLMLLMLWLVGRQVAVGAGQLCWESGQRAAQWHWREKPEDDWQLVAVGCDYLGPWLIGLRLDGRRLWVWPDSSDADSRRLLRRQLVTLP